jgi:CheY-like chemotaxis protein
MPQSTDIRPMVLIVDDDPAARNSLAAVMEAFGFRTRTAASGSEGLDSIATEAPSAVITDLQMPGMTGIDLITALRRSRSNIPVIAISGGDVQAAKHVGAAAAFHKPLPVFEVIETLSALTQQAA